MFNNSVRTGKKTLHFTVTNVNWLTLFKEIIAVCIENYTSRSSSIRNSELLIVDWPPFGLKGLKESATFSLSDWMTYFYTPNYFPALPRLHPSISTSYNSKCSVKCHSQVTKFFTYCFTEVKSLYSCIEIKCSLILSANERIRDWFIAFRTY
jgi:hypothetical protein